MRDVQTRGERRTEVTLIGNRKGKNMGSETGLSKSQASKFCEMGESEKGRGRGGGVDAVKEGRQKLREKSKTKRRPRN